MYDTDKTRRGNQPALNHALALNISYVVQQSVLFLDPPLAFGGTLFTYYFSAHAQISRCYFYVKVAHNNWLCVIYDVGDYPIQQYLRGTQKQRTITSIAKEKQQIMLPRLRNGVVDR